MIIAKSQEGDTNSKTGRVRLHAWLKSRQLKGPCTAFIRERDRQTETQRDRDRDRHTETDRNTESEDNTLLHDDKDLSTSRLFSLQICP